MGYIEILRLKQKIFFRKTLLNCLLLFFIPKNKFIISLSKNLDKYITLYQRHLNYQYYLQNNKI
ncbi:hypothetical protein D2A34_16120 [Clostridium chromiireducens]|uniref:Spo0E family sporulation regulatory protein-aspartic acid phosphatase n=1 Tax=Clostridium chromiireducens TaxID=225345 RepID=A0A399IQU4_9CLOT|nr:hypothetical protein D2A34_16120 [Clostridium chromiireducens]